MTNSTSIYAIEEVLYDEEPEIKIGSEKTNYTNSKTEFYSIYTKTYQDDSDQECYLYEDPEHDMYSGLLFLISDKFINRIKNMIKLKDLSDNQQFFLDESINKLNTSIELEREFLLEEKIDIPSDKVINKTNQLLALLAQNTIFPQRITTSIEGGVCLIFDNAQLKLYLEIYNTGEMGYIIEDSLHKKLIDNVDLDSLIEASERITNFYR